MPTSLISASLAAVVASAAVLALLRQKKQQTTYPPGPPPKPIIGNALDVPFEKPWLKYLAWSKQYNSDIIHLSVMNTHIIVLHKMKDVIALMEKRSAIYSGRPSLPIFKLLDAENLTAMMDYGNDWRKHRKLYKEGLRKDLMPLYMHIQTEKVYLLLQLLLNDSEDFMEHCKWLSTANIMSIIYNYDVIPGQEAERFVSVAEESVKNFVKLFQPTSTFINLLPFLMHIPPWVPGASTQRLAAQVRRDFGAYKNEPFEYVERNLASGKSKECMLVDLLQHRTKINGAYEDESILKNMIATAYVAGVETVQTVLLIFFFSMACNPAAQKKAQEEIDRIIGTERLPAFEDRASLPYVEAIFRETLRWRVITPLAPPHTSVDDDMYNGFYFPKGSIVTANVWAITRDESVYPDPESFKPERFFSSDGTLNDDTVEYAFGFGRRICPGRSVADTLLWLVAATVLSTFNISKAKDENGAEIEIDLNAFTSSATSAPLPFKCSITPRSLQAKTLIHNAVSEQGSEV
ncbi:hypothetical protein AX15_003776 [Amanita polypyramis BW_CC]|nr:hypothetical protein AX15_003776 [Amanita polypyramis BW_CC]